MIIIHYKHKHLFSLAIFLKSLCPERDTHLKPDVMQVI